MFFEPIISYQLMNVLRAVLDLLKSLTLDSLQIRSILAFLALTDHIIQVSIRNETVCASCFWNFPNKLNTHQNNLCLPYASYFEISTNGPNTVNLCFFNQTLALTHQNNNTSLPSRPQKRKIEDPRPEDHGLPERLAPVQGPRKNYHHGLLGHLSTQ